MAQYTCYFKPKIYCNITQKMAKQFTLHSAEAYSKRFQTFKQGGYLFGDNHKNNQTTQGKDTQYGNLKARLVSVLNHWKKFEITYIRNQITYLQS